MGLDVLLLIFASTWAIPATPISDPCRAEEGMIGRLRSLDWIGGKACGAAGMPGEFFTLSQIAIASGTAEQCEEMLRDRYPVVRCMGLAVLAQMGGRERSQTIRSYLKDRGLIEYMPIGCSWTTTTVGAFAADLLLTNGRVLGHSGPFSPLVSEDEWVGLYLEILAGDSTVASHGKTSTRLQREIGSGKARLRLTSLRESAPSLQEFEIIKAVGRLPGSSFQRDLLITCIDSNSLDDMGRLAAASALTRHTDDTAVQALQRNQDALNCLGDRTWGDEFIETANARKTHEKNIRVFRPFAIRRKKAIVAAMTNAHPLALGTLLKQRPGRCGRGDQDIRQAWADSLVAISRRASDLMQPWNTYGDTVFQLDFLVQVGRSRHREQTAERSGFVFDENWLTVQEFKEIEKNVTEALGEIPPTEQSTSRSGLTGRTAR